jgi:hypothetical protein
MELLIISVYVGCIIGTMWVLANSDVWDTYRGNQISGNDRFLIVVMSVAWPVTWLVEASGRLVQLMRRPS